MTPCASSEDARPEQHGAAGGVLRCPLDEGDRATVVRARALVEGTLTMLGAGREAVEDAETMTAELVGNAVRHAVPPIELRVSAGAGSVHVAVADGDERLPIFPPGELPVPLPTRQEGPYVIASDANLQQLVADLEEYGRGLAVVQRLSSGCCGAETNAAGGHARGKTVWFSQDLPTTCESVRRSGG